MKKWILIALILMLTLAVASAEGSPRELILTSPGSALFVFVSNPTTGYEWTVSVKNAGVVEVIDDEYLPGSAQGQSVGAGGYHLFTLGALTPGEAVVEFLYGRSWEASYETRAVYLISVLEDGSVEYRSLEGVAPLEGVASEIEGQSALITTETNGDVLCLFADDMALPVEGERVSIWFNGVMTMSLPAQINVLAWEAVPPEVARD